MRLGVRASVKTTENCCGGDQPVFQNYPPKNALMFNDSRMDLHRFCTIPRNCQGKGFRLGSRNFHKKIDS